MKSLLFALALIAVALPTFADRLEVNGFAGEVLDTMSGATHSGFTGGFVANYRVLDRVGLHINTYHAKRRAEDSASEIIFDADSVEWTAGLSFDLKGLNEGETAICLIGEGGFVQLLDTPGDVIDNHFVGVGVDHRGGTFGGSTIAFGYGKTDLFADRRNSRFKARALLNYSGATLPMDASVFLRGDLDSDLRDGTDGLRIVMGTYVPFARFWD